jgi:hypothetical protein
LTVGTAPPRTRTTRTGFRAAPGGPVRAIVRIAWRRHQARLTSSFKDTTWESDTRHEPCGMSSIPAHYAHTRGAAKLATVEPGAGRKRTRRAMGGWILAPGIMANAASNRTRIVRSRPVDAYNRRHRHERRCRFIWNRRRHICRQIPQCACPRTHRAPISPTSDSTSRISQRLAPGMASSAPLGLARQGGQP